MKNKIEENAILNSIIDELRRFERQDLYRCYYCSLYFNWDDLLTNAQGGFYAFAYVWNKTDNDLSEFGTISLQSFAVEK